jgi:hypothetical protein
MPGGDKTGLAGLGPRTGRPKGYCSGFDAPGYSSNVDSDMPFAAGIGGGKGRGGGQGRGRGKGRVR